MSKLAPAIRNHFVVVPFIEAKALSPRSPRRIPAPITQGSGTLWHSPSVVIPRLSAALRRRLSPVDIEAMNASVLKPDPPASTPSLLPDATWASGVPRSGRLFSASTSRSLASARPYGAVGIQQREESKGGSDP